MLDFGNKKFWDLVEALDWKNLCTEDDHDVRKVKAYKVYKELKLTPIDINGFHEVAVVCRKFLKYQIEGYSLSKFGNRHAFPNNSGTLTVSDDGFWDLCSHIVGLGKETYEDVCSNPEKILEYPDYVENFEYLFQYKDYMDWLITTISGI